ncbi:threonine synthase [Paratrimastix pyriformis]|uniref:Threonine synthase n=1 Tax=Paratrimastix pyriformis TaxID=342808 RepID=A0ABQ8UNS8_9EUKA|nr:threonine synthase [Paratrimastix pyriformis]|eukprot:GAFH01001768.1.p1 GENE.GAFH01001768.1~~GAFH01001768.1.p1  ORF type:complete len:445 (-),score=167.63 GAFH01001768.1:78-1412(-)
MQAPTYTLRCSVCNREYHGDAYVCPHCEGNFDLIYDYAAIRRSIEQNGWGPKNAGMWRYLPLLPINPAAEKPSLLVGSTPLYRVSPRAATLMGCSGIELFVKDEGRNPTASLKDRASSLLVAKAVNEGKHIITTASTGNAAAALCGLSACMNLPAVIFVPATAPPAKIAQMRAYGARVLLVESNYDAAFDLCKDAATKYGWYCRNTGYNAFTSEGKKTCSLELCEQFAELKQAGHELAGARFAAPDWVVVSVGDGNIISGIWSGLRDLHAMGLIDRMPRLLGAQAEGSNYVHLCMQNPAIDPNTMAPIDSKTVADSIGADLPRDRVRAVRALRSTNGTSVQVNDEEILRAIPVLARNTGVFAEPAAACSLAALQKACREGIVRPGESVVLVSTGNGLKDIASAQRAVDLEASSPQGAAPTGSCTRVAANMAAVEQVVSQFPKTQ